MALKNLFDMVKADRYTQDGREALIKAQEAETEDKVYQIGEISQKTGLQKTANGWVKPKNGKQPGAKKEENKAAPKSLAGTPMKKADLNSKDPYEITHSMKPDTASEAKEMDKISAFMQEETGATLRNAITARESFYKNTKNPTLEQQEGLAALMKIQQKLGYGKPAEGPSLNGQKKTVSHQEYRDGPMYGPAGSKPDAADQRDQIGGEIKGNLEAAKYYFDKAQSFSPTDPSYKTYMLKAKQYNDEAKAQADDNGFDFEEMHNSGVTQAVNKYAEEQSKPAAQEVKLGGGADTYYFEDPDNMSNEDKVFKSLGIELAETFGDHDGEPGNTETWANGWLDNIMDNGGLGIKSKKTRQPAAPVPAEEVMRIVEENPARWNRIIGNAKKFYEGKGRSTDFESDEFYPIKLVGGKTKPSAQYYAEGKRNEKNNPLTGKYVTQRQNTSKDAAPSLSEIVDRVYNIGEISEKTGLQKTANGWRPVKKGAAGKTSRANKEEAIRKDLGLTAGEDMSRFSDEQIEKMYAKTQQTPEQQKADFDKSKIGQAVNKGRQEFAAEKARQKELASKTNAIGLPKGSKPAGDPDAANKAMETSEHVKNLEQDLKQAQRTKAGPDKEFNIKYKILETLAGGTDAAFESFKEAKKTTASREEALEQALNKYNYSTEKKDKAKQPAGTRHAEKRKTNRPKAIRWDRNNLNEMRGNEAYINAKAADNYYHQYGLDKIGEWKDRKGWTVKEYQNDDGETYRAKYDGEKYVGSEYDPTGVILSPENKDAAPRVLTGDCRIRIRKEKPALTGDTKIRVRK